MAERETWRAASYGRRWGRNESTKWDPAGTAIPNRKKRTHETIAWPLSDWSMHIHRRQDLNHCSSSSGRERHRSIAGVGPALSGNSGSCCLATRPMLWRLELNLSVQKLVGSFSLFALNSLFLLWRFVCFKKVFGYARERCWNCTN
jgi:hypothetical protein